MNKYLLLAAAVLMTGSLAACGDDGTTTDNDTGSTETDTGVTEDTTDDTTVEAECGDGVINGTEVCDGTAFGDATCASQGFMSGDLACNADCMGFDTSACSDEYAFADDLSYVSGLQLPPEGEDCCFDFTGDGEVDNGLGGLLASLSGFLGDTDLQTELDGAIEGGSVTLLIEYTEIPDDLAAGGDLAFAFLLGNNDLNGDDAPDQDMATRAAGDGVFEVDPASFDASGPVITFDGGSVDSNVMSAGPSVFQLSIPIPGFGTADLEVQDAMLEGEISRIATGIATVNRTVSTDDGDIELGGGMLGGVIPIGQILDVVDVLIRNDCGCAGVDPDTQFLSYGENETDFTYEATCGDYDAAGCGADDGTICENLDMICGIGASLLVGAADVDTNANDIVDAYSIGLYVTMTGASLTDPPMAD